MKPFHLLLISASALASAGDNLEDFEDCVYQCEQTICNNNPYYLVQEEFREILEQKDFEFRRFEPSWKFASKNLPIHLKLLQWDCPSNCDYQCQQIITDERRQRGEEILQFHGKWPFTRVFGIQEIASVLFSMLNFISHYLGLLRISSIMAELPGQRMTWLKLSFNNIRLLSLITMMAWICSSIFHVRDTPTTEKFDYYFAGLTVLTGFYCVSWRYFKLYLPRRKVFSWLFTLLCVAAYSAHIYRLETDWLYTYNMQANITIGVLQNALWAALCFEIYSDYYNAELSNENVIRLDHLQYTRAGRVIMNSFYTKSAKLYSLYPLLLCTIVIFGMSLEIFDFPPVFFNLIDAHSLWHLVTVIPAFMGWYDWIAWDISENVWGELADLSHKKEQ